jgi:hypothetical protein
MKRGMVIGVMVDIFDVTVTNTSGCDSEARRQLDDMAVTVKGRQKLAVAGFVEDDFLDILPYQSRRRAAEGAKAEPGEIMAVEFDRNRCIDSPAAFAMTGVVQVVVKCVLRHIRSLLHLADQPVEGLLRIGMFA